jgi:hypothetical protein
MGQSDRRHSQWNVWTFRLIVIAFVALAAVRPPTDAVLNLGMTILGAGDWLSLRLGSPADGLAMRRLFPGRRRRGGEPGAWFRLG